MARKAKDTSFDELLVFIMGDPAVRYPVARRLIGQSNLTEHHKPTAVFFETLARTNLNNIASIWQALGGVQDENVKAYLLNLNQQAPTVHAVEDTAFVLADIISRCKRYVVTNLKMHDFLRTLNNAASADEVRSGLTAYLQMMAELANPEDGLITSERATQEALAFMEDARTQGAGAAYVQFRIGPVHNVTGNPLDHGVEGMPRGGLTVLGGLPGCGKSALANKVAYANAENLHRGGMQRGVLVLSMEMQIAKWHIRYTSAQTGIRASSKAQMTEEQRQRFEGHLQHLGKLPILASERAGLTPATIKDYMVHTVDKFGGVELVVLDYARLASPDVRSARDNEALRVEQLFRELHELAINFKNPDGSHPAFLIVSEFNRDAEPPYGTQSLKYAGDYQAGLALAIVNAFQFRSNRFVKAVLGDAEPGQMLIQVIKNRFGFAGEILGLEFEPSTTNWRVAKNWRAQ